MFQSWTQAHYKTSRPLSGDSAYLLMFNAAMSPTEAALSTAGTAGSRKAGTDADADALDPTFKAASRLAAWSFLLSERCSSGDVGMCADTSRGPGAAIEEARPPPPTSSSSKLSSKFGSGMASGVGLAYTAEPA